MSDTIESIKRTITGAHDLKSVVRTMKALAAANIGQYERATRSLGHYYHTVELGLVACLRYAGNARPSDRGVASHAGSIGAVVFGSDQGFVGQFNNQLADFATQQLSELPGKKIVWPIGERIHASLKEKALPLEQTFAVPNAVNAITHLVTQVLQSIESQREQSRIEQVYLFHNRPLSGATYEPVSQRLLPLDERWSHDLAQIKWPTKRLPEVIGSQETALSALVREYLFVSLFKACAESLASENASRLAAMQRAEKNIGELLEDLKLKYHRLRQDSIDEELFDLISGFEALSSPEIEVASHSFRNRSSSFP